MRDKYEAETDLGQDMGIFDSPTFAIGSQELSTFGTNSRVGDPIRAPPLHKRYTSWTEPTGFTEHNECQGGLGKE